MSQMGDHAAVNKRDAAGGLRTAEEMADAAAAILGVPA